MTNHVDLTENHILQNYTYADEATRLAATGFVTADIGKVAHQESDSTFWVLLTITPAWGQIAGSGAAGTFTALSDTPSTYIGDSLQHIRVNTGETGLEFISVFGTLADGDVGKFDLASNTMFESGANVSGANVWTFVNTIKVPAATILVGNAMSLSEGGRDLVIADTIGDTMAFAIKSVYNDSTGAGVPFYLDFGTSFTYNIYTDDTQLLTANPLIYDFTSAVVSPNERMIDKLTWRIDTAMTNVAIKFTDNASGEALKYLPSQVAFDTGSGGYSWPAGDIDIFLAETGTDTATQFYYGFSPIILLENEVVDIEIIADTMNLLGDVSGNPYFITEAHDGPPTELSTSIATGLEILDEGNGDGWRLIGQDPSFFGNIGENAVDLSTSILPGTTEGATGSYSFAVGDTTIASGSGSVASGIFTEAQGSGSFAGNRSTLAVGNESAAFGIDTVALNNYSFAIGSYNVGTSLLTRFEIGIGTSDVLRENAFEVSTAGVVVAPALTNALITSESTGLVLVTRDYADEFHDPTGLEALDEGSGIGWRLTGKTAGNYGDVGLYSTDLSQSFTTSVVFGATGTAAFATGIETEASGTSSAAFGQFTEASGTGSLAGGESAVASGAHSVAFGLDNAASGDNSIAIGEGINAINGHSVCLGAFNVGTSILTHFELGIGDSDVLRSNGLEVYIDGTVLAPETTNALITAETTGKVLVTREYADANLTPTGLEKITETLTGWAFIGDDRSFKGDIGSNAIDMSRAFGTSLVFGATGDRAFALGVEVQASGDNSIASGDGSHASHENAVALGTDCLAAGKNSIAAGDSVSVTHQEGFGFGQGLNVINQHGFGIGKWNDGTSLVNLLEIGMGTSNVLRSNALEVDDTGKVIAPNLTSAFITADATGQILITRDYLETVPYLISDIDPLPDEVGAVAIYTDLTGTTVEPAAGFSVIATAAKVELNLKPSGTTSDTSIHYHDSLDNEVFEINRFGDTGGIQITNRVASFNIINEDVGNINITPAVTNNVTLSGNCIIASSNETNMRIRLQPPAVGAICGVHLREFTSGADVLSLNYNDGTGVSRITSNAAIFDIESTLADTDMQFTTVGTGQFLFNSDFIFTEPDATNKIFTINSGTFGAQIQIYDNAAALATLIFWEESTSNFFIGNIQGDIVIEGDSVFLQGDEVTIQGEAALGLPKLSIGNALETLQSSIFVELDDPDGSVTGSGGDVVLRADGANSASYESREATTGTNWFKRSVSPSNRIEIFNGADFDNLATAGVITITSDTTLVFMSEASFDTTTRIEMTSGDLMMTGDNYTAAGFVYTGGGTFITNNAAGSDVRLRGRLRIKGNSSGKFCSMINSSNPWADVGDWVVLDCDDCTLQEWNDLGEIERGVLFIRNTNLVLYNAPFTLTQTNVTSNNIALAFGGRAFEFFTAAPGASGETITIDGVTPVTMTDAPIYIDPHQAEGSTFQISNLNTGDTAIPIFHTAGGSTGTFTVVTDVSDGAHPITSVADSGGFARFTSGTSALAPGMTIVISGYVTNTDYNGTWIATNVIGSAFDASDGLNLVIFGTGEVTGVVTNDSVRVTSTAHGLSTGDTLYLDTDESTAYDGGYQIYNAATNTFDIDATPVGTATGSWDTSGRDQKDVRTLAINNKNQPSSEYIAAGYVNANVINVGTIVNGVYKVCIFGTAGVALLEGSTMERFKLIDEIEGEFEYTGTEPFDGHITFDFTVISSGGSQDFLFKWRKDTGAGFINLVDDAEALANVGSDAGSVSKTFPLTMETGDVIKPFVTRDAGTSPLTITYATIFANQ